MFEIQMPGWGGGRRWGVGMLPSSGHKVLAGRSRRRKRRRRCSLNGTPVPP